MVVKAANGTFTDRPLNAVTITVGVIGILIIVGAFWFSRRQGTFGGREEATPTTTTAKK